MSTGSSCLDPECDEPGVRGAPVGLCDEHLALAAEWVGRRDGVADLLPMPCLLCGSRLGVRWPSGWLCAVCEWRHGEPVDGELPPPRIDVVYYLRFRDRVKIGTSAQPRRRLRAIRHDELLAFERGDRAVERRRHVQFAADRLGGSEWFARSAALDTHIAALSHGVDDPWDLVARWTSEAHARQG
ncbi:GIY-YIG nuclease family protein [Microbacterium enclense]|uniref:GIY-YIG nuclease family protein n=1 Tax=Microbacterium enclense TaxID=993073 RepID=UPI0021A6F8A0|nr:GIY-YIG nuclease family protein [Microbacterium enclense]MCT2086971.1 GIY-YIG nuclease family protein [Microbacterium enclense]